MNYYLNLGLIIFSYMSFCFIISLIKKRNDVADVAWGLGFILGAWASFFISRNMTKISLIVCSLVTLWGSRLALHIYMRNKDKPEDFRYGEWRAAWGNFFYIRSYLQVYLLQGFFLFLIAIPIFMINAQSNASFSLLTLVGLGVWAFGFIFECIADAQLNNFMKNPLNKRKILQSGLWLYSRHPNYFGEITQWWGLWIITLSSVYGFIGIISPLTLTFLILKASGIPMLEKKLAQNPDFIAYQARTSILIPWFKKN